MHQKILNVQTKGRGIINLTSGVAQVVSNAACSSGLCNIFLKHTSASLIFCENADPSVLEDLERFMAKLVHDGDPDFTHRAEGPDDMSAHIRTVLTQNSLNIPVRDHQLDLGTWQGLYLWEHRFSSFSRNVVVTVMGGEKP